MKSKISIIRTAMGIVRLSKTSIVASILPSAYETSVCLNGDKASRTFLSSFRKIEVLFLLNQIELLSGFFHLKPIFADPGHEALQCIE